MPIGKSPSPGKRTTCAPTIQCSKAAAYKESRDPCEAQRVAVDLLQKRDTHAETPVVHGPAFASYLENHILNGVVVHAVALNEADLRRNHLPAFAVDFVAELLRGDVENLFQDRDSIAAIGAND